jgi:hypothetical protein
MKRALLLISAFLILAIGTQAQTHQAILSWTASPTTGVTGYNVYKITGVCPVNPTLGAFGPKLSSTTATVLSYTDTAITPGTTYCYVVTAFTAGGESNFSGSLQATVPVFTASTAPAPPGPLNGAVQ